MHIADLFHVVFTVTDYDMQFFGFVFGVVIGFDACDIVRTCAIGVVVLIALISGDLHTW